MLLSIDTSTNYASIAISHEYSVVAELTWRVDQRHGAELLQRVDWLMRTHKLTMDRLEAIAVALGPGSFNGVRTAVATAKALALALGIPVIGVPTLDVIGWGARASETTIWALLDAGRREVYAASYAPDSHDPSAWRPLATRLSPDHADPDDYHIVQPELLAQTISGRALFTGEWREETRVALVSALDDRARFVEPQESRRAIWLGQLGEARLRRGAVDTLTALEPLYLRRPSITSSRQPPRVTSPAHGKASAVGASQPTNHESSGGEGDGLALSR